MRALERYYILESNSLKIQKKNYVDKFLYKNLKSAYKKLLGTYAISCQLVKNWLIESIRKRLQEYAVNGPKSCFLVPFKHLMGNWKTTYLQSTTKNLRTSSWNCFVLIKDPTENKRLWFHNLYIFCVCCFIYWNLDCESVKNIQYN